MHLVNIYTVNIILLLCFACRLYLSFYFVYSVGLRVCVGDDSNVIFSLLVQRKSGYNDTIGVQFDRFE